MAATVQLKRRAPAIDGRVFKRQMFRFEQAARVTGRCRQLGEPGRLLLVGCAQRLRQNALERSANRISRNGGFERKGTAQVGVIDPAHDGVQRRIVEQIDRQVVAI
jgi:hypothetical protein